MKTARSFSVSTSQITGGSLPRVARSRGNVIVRAQSTAAKSLASQPRLSAAQSVDYQAYSPPLSLLQIRMLVYSWMQGNFTAAYELQSLILDSMPVALKNQHEMRESTRMVRFKALPWRKDAETEPTDSAKTKAALVNAALKNYRPEAGSDEKGWSGSIYQACGSINLPTILETQWQQSEGDVVPRCESWVSPRQMGFTDKGKLTVRLNTDPQSLEYNQSGMSPDLPPHRFQYYIFSTRSGPITMSGLMRSLSSYWGYMMYGRQWLFRYAEMFGQPVRSVKYDQDRIAPAALDVLKDMLANMGASPWIAIPNNAELLFEQFKGIGTDNPQRFFWEKADEYANLLYFGSTLTSGVQQNMGGNIRGSAKVQKDTRTKREEALAFWIAEQKTIQMARSILILNWGNDSECPTIEPDFSEVIDQLEQAQVVGAYDLAGWELVNADEAKRVSGLELQRKAVVVNDQDQNPNSKSSPNGKNGNGEVKAHDAVFVRATEKGKFAQFRDAVSKDLKPLLDRIEKLDEITDPDELVKAVDALEQEIPKLKLGKLAAGVLHEAMAEAMRKQLTTDAPRNRLETLK